MAVAQAPKDQPKTKEAAPSARKDVAGARTSVKGAGSGDYFVQVGAFKDPDTAKRLAARLREQDYPVAESVKRIGNTAADAPRPPARAPAAGSAGDRYDVIVSGGSAADINAKLSAKGLASEPAGDGVRIRPSLPLRDAVALSKDLGSEGFKVQVRRGSAGGAESPGASPPAGGGATSSQTLYRVRVGGYPDRGTALTVLRELEGKGYQPFIARGRE